VTKACADGPVAPAARLLATPRTFRQSADAPSPQGAAASLKADFHLLRCSVLLLPGHDIRAGTAGGDAGSMVAVRLATRERNEFFPHAKRFGGHRIVMQLPWKYPRATFAAQASSLAAS
jgi:hypothetical protein